MLSDDPSAQPNLSRRTTADLEASVARFCEGGKAERPEEPYHQPDAPEAPIPGRHWYQGCDPDGPTVSPEGICRGCGASACPECGRSGAGGCPVCTLDEYERGWIEGLGAYAWFKDGTQYVGTTGTTRRQAIERFLTERGKAKEAAAHVW